MVRVKICCIRDQGELNMAIGTGADAIGLVGRMPSGPGPIPDERIRALAAYVPPSVSAFLLTSETEGAEIIAHQQRTLTDTIQLVDHIRPEVFPELRRSLPGIRLVQVIHIMDESAIDFAIRAAQYSDALLLDSGNPGATIKTLGGTGNVHNWKYSARIVQSVSIPVFLAGGLHGANVGEAIETVQPFGVDVCSGLRTNGRLDQRKLDVFMEEVGKAG